LFEAVHAGHNRKTILLRHHSGDTLASKNRWRNILIEAALHSRFVIEEIQVRRTACLEKKNDPLGAWRKIGEFVSGGSCPSRCL